MSAGGSPGIVETVPFWPASQAELHDHVSSDEKSSFLSYYNCIWSSAIVVGTLVMGVLYEYHKFLPFILVSVLSFITLIIILAFKLETHSDHDEPVPDDNHLRETRTKYFLRITYIANSVVWGSRTAMTTIIPVINENMGRTAKQNSYCIAAVFLLLTLSFFRIKFIETWKYKLAPLFVGQIIVVAGVLGSGLFLEDFGYLLFFLAVTGIGAAITYSASQFYSLDTRDKAGVRIGLHESFINAGSIIIPLVAGAVGQYFGQDIWSFYAIIIVLAIAFIVQIAIAYAKRSERNPVLNEPPQEAIPETA